MLWDKELSVCIALAHTGSIFAELLVVPRLYILLFVAVLPSCIAGLVPPSQTEVGSTMQHRNGEVASGLRFSTGMHMASVASDEVVQHDVGVGYVYESLESETQDISQVHQSSLEARNGHGAYVSAARVIARNARENHRTWLGIRAQYLFAPARSGGSSTELSTRLHWELFGQFEGAGGFADDCVIGLGYANGAVGFGVYAEASGRRYESGSYAVAATAGISMRLPFLIGGVLAPCAR